ncbi:hypothetical protein F5Y19DRAFT_474002 [Xylariaceae sp. FL1651]|nr:hypothetical protein F5Y19DRAFT_474002 [Xylariaceae sp. FL1651]
MDESGQANYFDLPIDSNEPQFHLDPFSPTEPSSTPGMFSGADGVLSHFTHSCSAQTSTPSPVMRDEVNPGILLADLQQSLSKQLDALESKHWNLTTLSITSSATTASGGEQELGQEEDFNPVASILASTSDFVAILRFLRKPPPNSPIFTVSGYSPIDAGFRICTYYHLTTTKSAESRSSINTINCYFLVLSIFDGIFSRLLANSEETCPQGSTDVHVSSPSSPFSLQNSSSRNRPPELLFAGHSVTLNARLRTRLLVQVVEHQLEILEHDHGLPQPYCVSSARAGDAGNKPVEDGILSRRESLLLLQAVMGWTPDTDDPDAFYRGEELGRSPVTLSLIDKLKRVQRALTRH